jgi:hypothetical protein
VKRICSLLVMLCMLHSVPSWSDEVRLGIHINLPVYPELVVIPGYPVYYAPRLDANYFFYDGSYWLFQDDNWYESEWYDGPWRLVEPVDVPVFILRIPVFYYRVPPAYFFSWQSDEPPHWGDRWGQDWEDHRQGWDKWNHHIRRKPAPLPLYQRNYAGEDYPRHFDEQQKLQQKHYHYRQRDPLAEQRHRRQSLQRSPAQRDTTSSPENRGMMRNEAPRATPRRQENPAAGNPVRQRELIREQREIREPDMRNRGDGRQDQDSMRNRGREQQQDRSR